MLVGGIRVGVGGIRVGVGGIRVGVGGIRVAVGSFREETSVGCVSPGDWIKVAFFWGTVPITDVGLLNSTGGNDPLWGLDPNPRMEKKRTMTATNTAIPINR